MARTPEMAAASAAEIAAAAAPAPAAPTPPMTPPLVMQKVVVFTRTFNKYHRNDRCGFPTAYADQLIRKGVCIEVQESAAVGAMVRK